MSIGRAKLWRRHCLDIWFSILPGWTALLYWTIFSSSLLEESPSRFTWVHLVGLLLVGVSIFGCMLRIQQTDYGLRKAIWWGTVVFLFPFGCTLCYFTHLREYETREPPRPTSAPLPLFVQERLGTLTSIGKYFLILYNAVILFLMVPAALIGAWSIATGKTQPVYPDWVGNILLVLWPVVCIGIGIFGIFVLRLLRSVFPECGGLREYWELTLVLFPLLGLKRYSRLSQGVRALGKMGQ